MTLYSMTSLSEIFAYSFVFLFEAPHKWWWNHTNYSRISPLPCAGLSSSFFALHASQLHNNYMGLKSKRPPKKGAKGKKKEEDDTKTVSTDQSSEGEGTNPSAADQLAADGIIATYAQVI